MEEPREVTAVVQVNPELDEKVIGLFNESLGLQRYAENRQIVSDEAVRYATEDLALIAKLKRAFDEKHREYADPINKHLKQINEAFRAFTAPLDRADELTRDKVLAYRHEQERKAREAEEINRLRLEAARREMELKGEVTAPIEVVEVPPAPPAHVRGAMGTLGTTKNRKWEVEDISKVPLDYLVVDAAKVGKVVRAGIPSIPGIKIWMEDGLRISTR